MKPPHPPISYGTSERLNGVESARETVERVAGPIFEEAAGDFPQEEKVDSMAIYKGSSEKVLWRPNNYRRQMRVKPQKTAFINSGSRPLYIAGIPLNIAPSSKGLLFIKVSDRVKLQYGKNTLTAIWSQAVIGGEKETFSVPGEDFRVWVVEKRQEIAAELDAALFSFCRQYDLLIPGKVPRWERYEDWVRGERFIDSLPSECIIHADGLKKVYREGVEFTRSRRDEAPGFHAANFIENRMVERFAPEIARSLDRLAFAVNPLQRVFERVRVFPDDLLRPDVQALLGGLTSEEKLAFSEWCFGRFG